VTPKTRVLIRRLLRTITPSVVPSMMVLCLVVAIILYWVSFPTAGDAQATLVLVFAGCVLYGANKAVFTESRGNTDPLFVRYVIAYNAVIFIVVGLAALIILCKKWEIPFLISGACLLIGGFFGLLFGYPQGVAQKPVPAPPTAPAATPQQAVPGTTSGSAAASGGGAGATGAATGTGSTVGGTGVAGGAAPAPPTPGTVSPAQIASVQNNNLVAESAATLGKVIAGFTLAKITPVYNFFVHLCHTIAPALGPVDCSVAPVLAGSMLAYFLATGFLSGLFLPSYFMSGKFS
jgi:hypothetical protein